MAIGYLNVAHVSRGEGKSAVGAAAYAARTRLIDERTGEVFDYSRKSADLIFSGIFLPKGAPERMRDRAMLWNEAEQAEKRKDARTARRLIIALPHELTAKQRQQLLTDYIRENFMRKGLGVDASIHAPDAEGDDRNNHAHLIVTTRFIDKKGFSAKKDRESNERAALQAWQEKWAAAANYQLERYGHAARVSFQTPEGQEPQIHLGQAASALERKGIKTRVGEVLRQIVNDNLRGRCVANDQRAEGKEVEQEPQNIDRDGQDAAWQDSVDRAAIAYAEERRRQFVQTQANDRAAFERQGEAMAARHIATWGTVIERHRAEAAAIIEVTPTGYQPGTMAEAEQAASSGVSFLLGLFTSWAESITRSVSSTKGQAQPKAQRKPHKAKQQEMARRAEQQQEEHSRELEAVMQEQALERAAYERRRALMLFQQAGALQSFEQAIGDRSSMREAFDKHTEQIESHKAQQAEKAERTASRDRDGPELG